MWQSLRVGVSGEFKRYCVNSMGVVYTEVDYICGQNAYPYRNHPGHAEALRVEFFPNTLRYRELLEYFFQIHNPTTLHRHGNDIGSSYRSAIFVTSTEQRLLAERLIAAINASGKWPGKIMTEINKAPHFWQAESEHQDHIQRNPNGYTCHFDRLGWALPR